MGSHQGFCMGSHQGSYFQQMNERLPDIMYTQMGCF